jgi:hypothetical protein
MSGGQLAAQTRDRPPGSLVSRAEEDHQDVQRLDREVVGCPPADFLVETDVKAGVHEAAEPKHVVALLVIRVAAEMAFWEVPLADASELERALAIDTCDCQRLSCQTE